MNLQRGNENKRQKKSNYLKEHILYVPQKVFEYTLCITFHLVKEQYACINIKK